MIKMKHKISKDYDKEYDLFAMNFGGEVEHSREFKKLDIIFDFNKAGDIVGFEIFNFMKAVKKSDKEIEEIFKMSERKNG